MIVNFLAMAMTIMKKIVIKMNSPDLRLVSDGTLGTSGLSLTPTKSVEKTKRIQISTIIRIREINMNRKNLFQMRYADMTFEYFRQLIICKTKTRM